MDATKINLYQNDRKRTKWRRLGALHDPKHTTSPIKHDGGSAMALACIASNGTGSLVFIDDVTEDGSSHMNSEVYMNILSAHIQPNSAKMIGQCFTAQMYSDPVNIPWKLPRSFSWQRSGLFYTGWVNHLISVWSSMHSTRLRQQFKAERPAIKLLKTAAVNSWQSITKEKTQWLVMSMGCRLQAVLVMVPWNERTMHDFFFFFAIPKPFLQI